MEALSTENTNRSQADASAVCASRDRGVGGGWRTHPGLSEGDLALFGIVSNRADDRGTESLKVMEVEG
jgi:hypothetical protein